MKKIIKLTAIIGMVFSLLIPIHINAIENPFNDVSQNEYYYNPVLWAVENNITTGVNPTTFAPNKNCTRGQVVTFLWRAAGSPEPETINNPFEDISESSTFYKAILWAYENGITTGVNATNFDENGKCTRGQIVTFLWRYAGNPSYSISNQFADVPNHSAFKDAILWASENRITSGTGSNFYINRTCTRAQTVTFLYRYMTEDVPSDGNNNGNSSGGNNSNSNNSHGEILYATKYGKRYHFDPDCGGHDYTVITWETVEKRKLTPCKTCANG